MHKGQYIVYLDWNVIHGIARGKFSELAELLRDLVKKGNVLIPYTETHIYEASNVADGVEGRDGYIESNLAAISHIANAYMYEDGEGEDKNIMMQRDYPVNAFQDFDRVCNFFDPLAIEFMEKCGYQQIVDSMRERGFDPQVLNNCSPEAVVARLDELYAENYDHYKHLSPKPVTFMELVEMGCSTLANEPKLVVMSMYAMLDAAGYASDKKSWNVAVSRWFDSFHVFWSLACDCLITNDWRLRKKAQVIYGLLQTQTMAVDAESALPVVHGFRSTS